MHWITPGLAMLIVPSVVYCPRSHKATGPHFTLLEGLVLGRELKLTLVNPSYNCLQLWV